MTETNPQLNYLSASPAFPFNASDGYGAWKKEEGHFAGRFAKLLFDPAGHYVGEADLLEDLEVSGDKVTGAFTIRFNFLDGRPSLCSGGTAAGTRVLAH